VASARVRAAALRLADQQSSRFAEVPSARLLRATVTTVTAGGASDGNALVYVTWRGAEGPVADYPDSYTPVVGHRVLCALVDDQLSILHHSIGTP
jgi:hypothetical protein